jgi:hypothetical protein
MVSENLIARTAQRNAVASPALPSSLQAHQRLLADSDTAAAKGHLYGAGDDLRRLLQRPSTPISEAVASALATVR